MSNKVFISYAHNDPYFKHPQDLIDALSKTGYRGVIDQSFIESGDFLAPDIKRKIESAQFVLSILTPFSIKNHPWVIRELYEAVLQECIKKRKILFPVLMGGLKHQDVLDSAPSLELWLREGGPLYVMQDYEDTIYGKITETLKNHVEKPVNRNYNHFKIPRENGDIYRTGPRENWSKNKSLKYVQTVDSYLLYGYQDEPIWKHIFVCDENSFLEMHHFLDECDNIHVTGDGKQDNMPGKWQLWFLDLRCNTTGDIDLPSTNNCGK